MEKIKKRIANLKVAGKLKVYRMTVLVMTLFLVLVALISTLVIRSNIEKITEVWSPSLEYLQDLETMTAKYRIKQYQHLVESDAADHELLRRRNSEAGESDPGYQMRIWMQSCLQTVMLKKDRTITK